MTQHNRYATHRILFHIFLKCTGIRMGHGKCQPLPFNPSFEAGKGSDGQYPMHIARGVPILIDDNYHLYIKKK